MLTLRTVRGPLVLAALLFTLLLALTTGAQAARAASPALSVAAVTGPTHLPPGGTGTIAIYVSNIGAIPTAGEVKVVEPLPEGITTADTATGSGWTCTPTGAGQTAVTCTTAAVVNGGQNLPAISVPVHVDAQASGTVVNPVTASGGGAPDPMTFDGSLVVSPAPAAPGIQVFQAGAYDADGQLDTRAGGHPYIARTAFFLNTILAPDGTVIPAGNPKDINVDLPPGFVGNPLAAPRCPTGLVTVGCPSDTIVGIAAPLLQSFGNDPAVQGIFNDTPPIGTPAQFTFNALAIDLRITANLRSESDFGVTVSSLSTPQNYKVYGAFVALWGNPADPSHDGQRCLVMGTFGCVPPVPSTAPPVAFLTNPTDCPYEAAAPPVTRLWADTWEYIGDYDASTVLLPAVVDCDQVPFAPTAAIEPTTTAPDKPTGLNVDIRFPQDGLLDPDGTATASLKKAVVTLPEGMTINPAGAGGLQACSDAQLRLKSKDSVRCPDEAKIGTVMATTPLLDHSLTGGVYIRSQNSMDPESGEMFRIALVLESKRDGISIRLPGSIRADAKTGRLVTTFDNNPRLPVDDIQVKFKSGPRAPLATPATCGPKTVDTQLTSWADQTVNQKSTFTVNCAPGLGWFGPFFSADTVNPTAGAYSPFVLRVDKPDGQSDLNGIALSLPEGLLANLKGNVGTRIGTARVAAGPGSDPFWLSGPVVLEGPYGDAPFSLRVTVPAIAGPFNLGDVVVRQKIYVDPHDAHVTVVSDPLPTIVKGVPVRLQNLQVNVDKPGFMINPTSCAPKSIGGTLGAATGQTAAVASWFQVAGCDKLPLRPKMQMELKGKKEIKRGKHPTLSTTLTQGPGQSNLKSVKVRLPLSLALDPDNAEALCKPEQAAAKACPAASIVGHATAISPVLNQPLKGDVFFVEGTRQSKQGRTVKTLPKLWIALRGEVAIDVWADSSISEGKYLVTTFPFVPDAPISSFKLDINGGKHGILAVTGDSGTNLCKQSLVTKAEYHGQNGKQVRTNVRMGSPCGFMVQSRSVSSSRVKVRVSGIAAGRLKLTGKNVRTTRRTVKRATTATITARLSNAGQRAYRQGKAIRVRVAFNPKAKGEKIKHTRATVKRAKTTKKSSTRSHRSSRAR